MSDKLSKLSRWFSPKKAAVLTFLLLAVSLVPIFYLGYYNYPTGDSLRYGAAAHLALMKGNSFFSSGFWHAVWEDVRTEFLNFNGTWSAMILWRLDPDIWAHTNAAGELVGTHLYGITPWISILSISIGTFFFLYVILVRTLKLPKGFWTSVSSLTVFITVQWIPTARGGIYFYPGVIKYILAYGIMLLGLGWFLLYPETRKKRYLVLSAIALVYVGGAGYPEFLIAAVSCGLIFLVHLIRILRKHAARRQNVSQDGAIRPAWLLLIPFLLFMAAFLISAKAPGTAIRGGENASFSMGKAAATVLNCFTYGASQGIQYMKTAPLTALLFLGVILSTYVYAGGVSYEVLKKQARFFNPLLLISGYLAYAASFAAELFVGDNVTAGISGGVYDTYFMIFVLALVIAAAGCGWWLRFLHERKLLTYISESAVSGMADISAPSASSIDRTSTDNMAKPTEASGNAAAASSHPGTRSESLRAVWILLCLIACIAGGRHLFHNTLDYACLDFVRSGKLTDFIDQTNEYKAILYNEEIRNAVLPQMNDNQYPFMFMAPVEDPESFTCYAMEYFYDKETVTAVPRDAFYNQYGTDLNTIVQNEIDADAHP